MEIKRNKIQERKNVVRVGVLINKLERTMGKKESKTGVNKLKQGKR